MQVNGISVYMFDKEGMCVHGMNSYNANTIVEQLNTKIAELTDLQQNTVLARTGGFQQPKLERSRSSLGDPLMGSEETTIKLPGLSSSAFILTLVNSMAWSQTQSSVTSQT